MINFKVKVCDEETAQKMKVSQTENWIAQRENLLIFCVRGQKNCGGEKKIKEENKGLEKRKWGNFSD